MKYLKHKPGSIEEIVSKLRPEDSDYQAKFKKELEKTGKGIGAMSPKEKKDFFNKIDKMHKAKNEMTAAQKKLPPALQKAIKDKEQKEELNKDDESAVKKVKDMLKKASQAHAGQAKELDKAMKSETTDAKADNINQGKLDRVKKGEKDLVDPKPAMNSVAKTLKEMMIRKKYDTATMADTEKEKSKDKKTTLVGSKKTPIDTKPEIEFKN